MTTVSVEPHCRCPGGVVCQAMVVRDDRDEVVDLFFDYQLAPGRTLAEVAHDYVTLRGDGFVVVGA